MNEKCYLNNSFTFDLAEIKAFSFEIMLFLLIWGEAANIRHMPECLCFLFHKMVEFLLITCIFNRLEKSEWVGHKMLQ